MISKDLETSTVKTAYARWAPIYDAICGPVMVNGRRAAAAHNMTFANATFDCVVAQFVITLVASPEQVLSECHRVVKPGGRIILVNHLYSEVGIAAAVERWAAKKTRALGLRPEFPFARLQAWAKSNASTTLVERRKVAPFGIYTLVCFERTLNSQAA